MGPSYSHICATLWCQGLHWNLTALQCILELRACGDGATAALLSLCASSWSLAARGAANEVSLRATPSQIRHGDTPYQAETMPSLDQFMSMAA